MFLVDLWKLEILKSFELGGNLVEFRIESENMQLEVLTENNELCVYDLNYIWNEDFCIYKKFVVGVPIHDWKLPIKKKVRLIGADADVPLKILKPNGLELFFVLFQEKILIYNQVKIFVN